jgi:HK97 family phage major capsid protein
VKKVDPHKKEEPKLRVEHLHGAKKGQIEELPEDEARILIEHEMAREAKDEDDDADPETKKAVDLLTQAIETKNALMEKRVTQAVLDAVNKGYKPTAHITVGPDGAPEDPTAGFRNLGEFAQAVRKHYAHRQTDPRLKKMAAGGMITKADGMDESVLADGGALVPTEYADQLFRDVLQESVLFQRCRQYPINTGNSLFIPVRSINTLGVTSAAGGSLGTWLNADGAAITAAKPVYNRIQMTLNRWGTLLPVTEELLLDNNVALGNWITDEGTLAMAWDLNQAFVNGTGVSQPTGILASGALISAPADAGQASYTISYSNLVNMKSRLWTIKPNDFKTVVWIAHPDCEAQFEQLKDAAGRNLYFATGTIQQTPEPKLLGIPVVYSYHCPALGDAGDVILADLSQYIVSVKAGEGPRQAMSMHLYFDSAEVAYRIIYRIDGKTARSAPLNVPSSGNTRSGFVCVAARGGGPAS